jgi:hypothetical protein
LLQSRCCKAVAAKPLRNVCPCIGLRRISTHGGDSPWLDNYAFLRSLPRRSRAA